MKRRIPQLLNKEAHMPAKAKARKKTMTKKAMKKTKGGYIIFGPPRRR